MSEDSARRRDRRPTRIKGAIHQPPFRQITRPYEPIRVLPEDKILAIHDAALTILEEVGMKVLLPEARALYRAAGAIVDEASERVRLDRGLVMEKLATVPSEFTLRARNPARTLKLGGSSLIFSSVGGPAYVMDREKGRRAGTYAEMCDYLKLIQSLDIIHQEGGGPFEPLDLPAESRHLDLYLAEITLLDKNWHPQGLGEERSIDALEMAAISLGTTREKLIDQDPVHTVIINTNSPLQLDLPMSEGLITFAAHGQVVVVTPFTLSGAMSPVTLAGALAQQHAEAMAGLVLTQIVRPGVPAMYGGFTSNVDMRSGAPAFGTPEYALAAQISGQLARHLGVPFRSSNTTAANTVDAQAAYESQMSLWGALMGGAHMLLHGAGWLGGGLTASVEKLIIDAEMLQMMAAYFTPPEVSEASLALDAIREVGPAGHFFGTAHTIERYETAFYRPLLSNWDNHDTWVERGRMEAETRAGEIARQLLADYEKPPIDTGVEAALHDFVARRKREIHGKG